MAEIKQKIEAFIKPVTPQKTQVNFENEYIKLKLEEKVFDNKLLGKFEKEGYIIDSDIKVALVEAKKHAIAKDEKVYTCMLYGKLRNFRLELVVDRFSQDESIAELYLVEYVGFDPLKTFIANFTDKTSPEFNEIALKTFNISVDGGLSKAVLPLIEECEKQTEIDELPELIKKRLEELEKADASDWRFVVEMYSELYVLRMVKLLGISGELGKRVLEQYIEEMKRKGYTDKSIPNLYTKLRKLMDEVAEKNGGWNLILKDHKEEHNQVLKEFTEPILQFKKLAEDMEFPLGMPKKPAQKDSKGSTADAEKSSGGGSSGKGSGKGGGKGGDKGGKKSDSKDKKDDKKKVMAGMPEKKEQKKAPAESKPEKKPQSKGNVAEVFSMFNEVSNLGKGKGASDMIKDEKGSSLSEMFPPKEEGSAIDILGELGVTGEKTVILDKNK